MITLWHVCAEFAQKLFKKLAVSVFNLLFELMLLVKTSREVKKKQPTGVAGQMEIIYCTLSVIFALLTSALRRSWTMFSVVLVIFLLLSPILVITATCMGG